ncbi:hypothetical protein GCM10009765_78200 [Fodinicola feengrottensis]|uniref:LysM domain-containing protein n=2 Tax=Fodinicola feengrottensis TaxID=435914 RepID=A0ABP4V5Q0_9ACTN
MTMTSEALAPVIELFPGRFSTQPLEQVVPELDPRVREQAMWRHPAGKGRRVIVGQHGRRTGRHPGLRLTRRGRAVLVIALVLLAAGAAFWSARAMAAQENPSSAPASVVVQPGQSLWSIAVRYDPSRDPSSVIRDIQRLNGLSGLTVWAGYRLVLPPRSA